MGRGKTEIKKIENQNQRQATFYKRRDGLFKKAKELSVLCDTNLLLVIFSNSGKLYEFHTPTASCKELIEKFEMATGTQVWKNCRDQAAEAERVGKLCEFLEKELRFMTIDRNQEYTMPVLDILEHNLESAIGKIRFEKERKIMGETSHLENKVNYQLQERYGLYEKISNNQGMQYARGESSGNRNELDLKLGFN